MPTYEVTIATERRGPPAAGPLEAEARHPPGQAAARRRGASLEGPNAGGGREAKGDGDALATSCVQDARGVSLTFVVEAGDWVEAWHEAMRAVGDAEPPPDARCTMEEDGAFVVRAPASGQVFVVRPILDLPAAANPPPCVVKRPDVARSAQVEQITAPERGRVVTAPERGRVAGARRAAASERDARRPPLARTPTGFSGEVASEPRAVPKRRDGSTRLRSTADPAARRLRTDERALLAAASARRANEAPPERSPASGHGGPARRQAEPTMRGHGAVGPLGAGDLRAPQRGAMSETEHTADFHAMVSNHTPLPQQFPAMGPPSPRASAVDAIQEAVATAWRHVPCQLVQALRRRDDGTLEVVAARGERDREVLSRRVAPGDAFPTLRGQRPTRVKFAEQRARLRYTGGAPGGSLEISVRSTLCVPISVADRPWGVLLLVNASRGAGFVEGELRAVRYLVETLERALAR